MTPKSPMQTLVKGSLFFQRSVKDGYVVCYFAKTSGQSDDPNEPSAHCCIFAAQYFLIDIAQNPEFRELLSKNVLTSASLEVEDYLKEFVCAGTADYLKKIYDLDQYDNYDSNFNFYTRAAMNEYQDKLSYMCYVQAEGFATIVSRSVGLWETARDTDQPLLLLLCVAGMAIAAAYDKPNKRFLVYDSHSHRTNGEHHGAAVLVGTAGSTYKAMTYVEEVLLGPGIAYWKKMFGENPEFLIVAFCKKGDIPKNPDLLKRIL